MSETTTPTKTAKKNKPAKGIPREIAPTPLWEKFQQPCHLPEVAPSNSHSSKSDKEIREKLVSLQKEQVRAERASGKLRQRVQDTAPVSLLRPFTVRPFSPDQCDIPLDELTFDPPLSTQAAAGRAAVEHVQGLDRIHAIQRDIAFLNTRVD